MPSAEYRSEKLSPITSFRLILTTFPIVPLRDLDVPLLYSSRAFVCTYYCDMTPTASHFQHEPLKPRDPDRARSQVCTDTRRSRIEIRMRKTIPSRRGGYISYIRQDTTRTVFSTMPRRAGVPLLFTPNGTLVAILPSASLHISYSTSGGVGAQRAAVERVSYELRVTSYELRVTSYELLCNITIRLDANTNEPLTVHNAGCYYTRGWWCGIANLTATRRLNRYMSKTVVLAGIMHHGT